MANELGEPEDCGFKETEKYFRHKGVANYVKWHWKVK